MRNMSQMGSMIPAIKGRFLTQDSFWKKTLPPPALFPSPPGAQHLRACRRDEKIIPWLRQVDGTKQKRNEEKKKGPKKEIG